MPDERPLNPHIETPSPEGVTETPESLSQPEKNPEVRPESLHDKEGEKLNQILTKVKSVTPVSRTAVADDAATLSSTPDTEATIQKIVALAETKGVSHAVHVAQKLGDLYVLDMTHDELADRLYDALKNKGLIEEE